ncbi:hypothetical protein ACQPW1_29590 [Nocardia sp. CA-128927]|uniref:hypothetical protein n=1 Tax=Nocardia sp. CA-128927 TaxID=3239975 RepID=UPI003D95AE74
MDVLRIVSAVVTHTLATVVSAGMGAAALAVITAPVSSTPIRLADHIVARSAEPATNNGFPEGKFHIKHQKTGLCLAWIFYDRRNNLGMFDCNTKDQQQLWYFDTSGSHYSGPRNHLANAKEGSDGELALTVGSDYSEPFSSLSGSPDFAIL